MNRERRIAKLAGQIATAQKALADAQVDVACISGRKGRIYVAGSSIPHLADHNLRAAGAAIGRARRGLELLEEEQRQELRLLEAALVGPASNQDDVPAKASNQDTSRGED
jgi:hypothetical protein